MRPVLSFEGATVLITGGSRGLGLALARQLGAEGARLILVARDRAELRRAEEDLHRRGVREILTIAADVRQETQVKMIMEQSASFSPRLDVLINNAGIITVGPLHTMTRNDFEEAMALHFWAPLLTMQEFMPLLKKSPLKRIVNVASFGGKFAVPHMAPYCASKFALVGLSDAIRAEVAEQGIRVTTVCPGLVRTGSHLNAMFKGAHEEEFAWFSAGMAIPGGAIGADRAARQIVEACRRGQPELIITPQARLAIMAQALFPNLTARFMSMVNRRLPHAGPNTDRHSGWQSRGATSSEFTATADRATEEFNGLRGHPSAT
jgi:NAD(P)-dependent dehydrogenase (short-subunit alcohol dehydrogenase family)